MDVKQDVNLIGQKIRKFKSWICQTRANHSHNALFVISPHSHKFINKDI